MSPASIKSGIYRSGEVFTFDIFVVADLVVDVVVFVGGHEHVALHVDLLEDNLALLGLLHPQPVATSVLLYPSSKVRKSSVLYHYSQNQSVEGYTGSFIKAGFSKEAVNQLLFGLFCCFLDYFHSKIWAPFHFGTFEPYKQEKS